MDLFFSKGNKCANITGFNRSSEKIFKNGAIWCVLVYILIRFLLK